MNGQVGHDQKRAPGRHFCKPDQPGMVGPDFFGLQIDRHNHTNPTVPSVLL